MCGALASQWVMLFMYTYKRTEHGYEFIQWPDGRPTLEQENVVLDCFSIVREELLECQR